MSEPYGVDPYMQKDACMYSKRIRRVMGIFWFMMCATDVWIAQLQSHTFWETSVWIKPDTLIHIFMWPLSLYREGGCVCVCFEILYFVIRKIPTSRLSMSSLRYLFLGFFFLFIKFNLKFFLWFSLGIVLYSNAQKNMVIKSILLISYLIRRLHTKKLSSDSLSS